MLQAACSSTCPVGYLALKAPVPLLIAQVMEYLSISHGTKHRNISQGYGTVQYIYLCVKLHKYGSPCKYDVLGEIPSTSFYRPSDDG